MFRQYALSCGDRRTVGWIDFEPRLKRGTILTLKGDERPWVVEFAGAQTLESAPDMTWQVGGIVGRMSLPARS